MDILSKFSSETADRPRSIAANEIMSGGMRTVLSGVGENLKKLRRCDEGILLLVPRSLKSTEERCMHSFNIVQQRSTRRFSQNMPRIMSWIAITDPTDIWNTPDGMNMPPSDL